MSPYFLPVNLIRENAYADNDVITNWMSATVMHNFNEFHTQVTKSV
ncbi:MAG: hypothetical protein K6E51_12475 [Treponema sp.]|nr:hypothetical protein [Treponema sp.]